MIDMGLSDRATAAVASSVLQDIGSITESDMSLVIDKSTVQNKILIQSNSEEK